MKTVAFIPIKMNNERTPGNIQMNCRQDNICRLHCRYLDPDKNHGQLDFVLSCRSSPSAAFLNRLFDSNFCLPNCIIYDTVRHS